jgi:hypothetical protein
MTEFSALKGRLAFTRGFGDEWTHLLLHVGGLALGTGDLASFVFFEAHDAHKLFSAFDADIFIGGHDRPPEAQYNNYITIIKSSLGYCKVCPGVGEKISAAPKPGRELGAEAA